MSEESAPEISDASEPTLDRLIETCNERLEEVGQIATNHAFNLGFSIGLIPAAVVVILALIIFKGKLSAVIISAAIAAIALLAFANMTAYIAGTKSIQRVYQSDLAPEIASTLSQLSISPQEFEKAVQDFPTGAPILKNCLQSKPGSQPANQTSQPEE